MTTSRSSRNWPGDRIRLDLAGGHARGLELYARGETSPRLSWWASYALAEARDKIRSFGIDGQIFPFEDEIADRYDQRHTIYADVSLRPTLKWQLNMAWQYRTGWPYTNRLLHLRTAADGSRYFAIELDDPLAEDYPAVHLLDARLNRTFRVAGGRLHALFEVTNVYDHGNVSNYVFFIDCRGSPNPEDCRLHKEEDLWLGLLPSLGLSWTWDL